MDPKVKKAFEMASLMATFNNQKRILDEEYAQSLIYYYNGGSFAATEQRLSFVNVLKSNNIESYVLVDDNNTPVLIENINDFFDSLMSHYKEATNLFFYGYKKITSNKKIESMLDD